MLGHLRRLNKQTSNLKFARFSTQNNKDKKVPKPLFGAVKFTRLKQTRDSFDCWFNDIEA